MYSAVLWKVGSSTQVYTWGFAPLLKLEKSPNDHDCWCDIKPKQ